MIKRNFMIILISILLACYMFMMLIFYEQSIENKFYTNWLHQIDESLLVQMIRYEHMMLDDWMSEEKIDNDSIYNRFIHLLGIDVVEVKSYVTNEIPGLSTFEKTVGIAHEQVEQTTYEAEESGLRTKENKNIPDEQIPLVFLYNTHNEETFKQKDAPEDVEISKLTTYLAKELEKQKIGTKVDDTDMMATLQENNWSYGKAYDASREVVKQALSDYKEIAYVFDIHRDSLPKDRTTIEINNENYASILFVIGKEHEDYEKNLRLANTLHEELNKLYPNLSKGVLTKEGVNANGKYNQDLSENALLIEFGGHENDIEEVYRTADAFVEIFMKHYKEASKVIKMK